MADISEAFEIYAEKFGADPLIPYAISDERFEEVVREAIRAGVPIPEDFDWWSDLPDGADA